MSKQELGEVSTDEALLEDVNLEDEGLDEDVENDEEALFESDEDEEEPEEDDVEEEDDETEDDETEDEEESKDDSEDKEHQKQLFDKKQQEEVNRIIKSRLERQEAKLTKDLTEAAGVEITREEIVSASRLWGLLKANPDLSGEIDAVILKSLSAGKAKAPDAVDTSVSAVEQRLELKEAILDLKAEDKVFNKNADKIMSWAKNEGYEITNSKALRLAYLAWKGSQGKVEELVQKTTAQRKQTVKQSMQKKASVQSTKSGKPSTGVPNYNKMSDATILATEGLSLFTED